MSALQELRALLRFRPLQLLGLAGFLAAIGGISFHLKYCVLDLDIWWHLKVGDWILANRAVPHTGILSRTAATRPWVAYSWGYEVLLSWAYRWFPVIVNLCPLFVPPASVPSIGSPAAGPGAPLVGGPISVSEAAYLPYCE